MGNGRERRKRCWGRLRELEAGEVESRKKGCFDEARTGMHWRVGAGRRIAADERVRKNRSMCMLISLQQ